MKKCILCDSVVGFVKFKSLDGYVCKKCYEVVSLNFTQTIRTKSKAELLKLYDKQGEIDLNEDFEITRKINQFVLFDDTNKLVCLPNNPSYTSEKFDPEMFEFSAIKNCELDERIYQVKEKKKDIPFGVIRVAISIEKDNKVMEREVLLVSKPIMTNSSSYKTMKKIGEKMVYQMNQLRC